MKYIWFLPLLCLLGTTGTSALEDGPQPLSNPEVSAKVERSIHRACKWLAQNQQKTGGLRSSYSVPATGLAGLAWLASGSTPRSGPFAENIRRALRFILKSQSRRGFISERASYGPSGMYGHGYASQFLAQVAGMINTGDLRQKTMKALRKAVVLTESTQNQFGGWNASPNAAATDDGSGAVAIMQITALRAAGSCGIHIRRKVIDKAKKYLLAMTNGSGWYAYNWHARGGSRGSLATTGAGMYMLGALNLQDEAKYKKGIKNLIQSSPYMKGGAGRSAFGGWYQYTVFYSSLAIYQRGGTDWYRWYKNMSRDLMQKQTRQGNWSESYGGVFTALATLSLALPLRYLPMFQEGGAGREGR